MRKRLTIVVLALLIVGTAPAGTQQPQRPVIELQTSQLTAKDLKTIQYVENAHGQLDEWADRFVARLKRGLGPRERDPILDGRARFQVEKLRVTYAGYTSNPELTKAIKLLAIAHERRLHVVDSMRHYGIDRERYLTVSAEVDGVMGAIRTWGAM